MRPSPSYILSPQQIRQFDHEGYLILPGLFDREIVEAMRWRFDAVAAAGLPIEMGDQQYWVPDLGPEGKKDPLRRFPRMMMPHRYDSHSRQMMLSRRVHEALSVLMRDEPVAAQSMYYFKPCGARGQAFHQDDFFVLVNPGRTIAVWTAIDPSAPENGGLFVVPGTQDMDVVCPEQADMSESFSPYFVKPPAGMRPVPARLNPGDSLVFSGRLLHGSGPNRSRTTWRRSFICHYVPRSARQISHWYFPLLDFDGNEVPIEAINAGGPCGEDLSRFSYIA